MAGAFIAFGGATSSTAVHAVENVGVARALAGCIFPVGLMLIVFLGGELFTRNFHLCRPRLGSCTSYFPFIIPFFITLCSITTHAISANIITIKTATAT